jgi:hypothetical protein
MRTNLIGLLPAAFLVASGLPAHAVDDPPGVHVPPARVGDAWRVEIGEEFGYDLRVEGRATARDRFGRLLDAFAVSVDGFHPLATESKEVTRHTLYVDAASGTQVADVAEYVFGGGTVTSQPAAYAAYEPNDPDGWPGWVQTGGLLAGRHLVPGQPVSVPFVMTSTRGADRIELTVEEAPPRDGAACVRAWGRTDFPTYTYWTSDGYQRGWIGVALDATYCEDAPYAVRNEVRYFGAFEPFGVTWDLAWYAAGAGEAVGTGAYAEPAHSVLGSPVPFDGSLRDGGALPFPGVEWAQEAAGLAPGLLAWRLVHPDGYLVEAEYLAPETAGLAAGTHRWRLVYASPSGDHHQVTVSRQGEVGLPLDEPQVGAYPAPVPPLSSMPAQVVSPAGALAAWQAISAGGGRLVAMRWQPLLDYRWYVQGGVDVYCDGAECGDLYMEIPFDYETGAAGTGEAPLPSPPAQQGSGESSFRIGARRTPYPPAS